MNFVSVSGILRADFSSLDYSNNTIVTGDAFGGLNLWAYTSARKVEFKSTTRSNTSSNTNDEVTQVELFENETRCAQLNSNPRRLLMHSTKNGSLSKQFEISADFLRFAVSNDSKRLVTVSGNRLQVWNITDNSLDLLFTNTTNDSTLYQNVDVSPDGKYVASGNRDKVVLFNVTSPSKLDYLNVANQLKSEQNYFNVKFLPNDTHLATTNGAYLMHW
jgi:WD40 repeat protein